MDCDVCLEPFDDKEHRPKSLPCGHTFCLRCVTQQKEKKCPVDRKAYRSIANNLPDNFKIIELAQRPSSVCGWCRSCDALAAEGCLDDHASSICSLKKARQEDVEPRLSALGRGQEALAKLGDMMRVAANDVQTQVQDCFGQVELGRLGLAADRERQELTLATDPATWVLSRTRRHPAAAADRADGASAKAEPSGQLETQRAHPLHDHVLAHGAAQLLADLADPAASCVVTVVRGDGQGLHGLGQGEVLWRGAVRPEEDAASRLLLSRMLCERALRRELPLPLLQVKTESPAEFNFACPLPVAWADCSNEVVLTGEQMQVLLKVGSRVVRGEDWDPRLKDDGDPPGPGTVVAEDSGCVAYYVVWDAYPHERRRYFMVPCFYRLRLLPTRPQASFHQPKLEILDVSVMQCQKKPVPDKRMFNKKVLVGLHCDVAPNWSKNLLHRMAPQLQGLAVVSAQQQHLQQAVLMPGLRALHLAGRPVAVDPVVDLTGGEGGGRVAALDSLEYAVEKAPLPRNLQWLHIEHATRELLMQVPSLASLRCLDVHCPFVAALPVMCFEAAVPPAGLGWLRLGIHPLRTALALVRAHAASLQGLELEAATKDPYGCPDLPQELQRCGLRLLRRLVLWRATVAGAFCRHHMAECVAQKAALALALALEPAAVLCSECDLASVEATARPTV